jgi:hypothetical protein
MVQASLEWRKEIGADEIRKQCNEFNLQQRDFPFYERATLYFPHNIHHGHDKLGQPIGIDQYGSADPAKLCAKIKIEDMLRYQHYHCEMKQNLVDNMSFKQNTIVRTCKVIDLKHFSSWILFHSQGISFFQEMIRFAQDNYPECMGNVYIINVPTMFNLIWKMVAPFLSPTTQNKIKLLSDPEDIFQYIDKDQLPKFMGGTCECKGGCVPGLSPKDVVSSS